MSQEYDSGGEEDNLCPLCMEELDITERNFKPCTCGYQICRFCWHHIKENLNGRCPHCRKPYEEGGYTFVPPNPEELERLKRDRKQREKKSKEADGRKNLGNIRVVQRNLVYITNLALPSAKEELLKKHEFFGQYGKILKIVVNKTNLYNVDSPEGPSVSAYITYQKKEDAVKAILAVNGAWLDARQLRASFGTTKYCSFFLRNMHCTNPDCMYLHELGGEKDSFTKEEMAAGKHLLLPEAIQQPFTPIAGKPGLPPPPIIIQKEPSSLTSSTASLKESKEIPITTTTTTTTSPPPPTTTIVPIVQPIPTPINLTKSTDKVAPSIPTTVSPPPSTVKENKTAWAVPPPPKLSSDKNWPTLDKAATSSAPFKLSTSIDKPASNASSSALPATASWASKAVTTMQEKEEKVVQQQEESGGNAGYVYEEEEEEQVEEEEEKTLENSFASVSVDEKKTPWNFRNAFGEWNAPQQQTPEYTPTTTTPPPTTTSHTQQSTWTEPQQPQQSNTSTPSLMELLLGSGSGEKKQVSAPPGMPAFQQYQQAPPPESFLWRLQTTDYNRPTQSRFNFAQQQQQQQQQEDNRNHMTTSPKQQETAPEEWLRQLLPHANISVASNTPPPQMTHTPPPQNPTFRDWQWTPPPQMTHTPPPPPPHVMPPPGFEKSWTPPPPPGFTPEYFSSAPSSDSIWGKPSTQVPSYHHHHPHHMMPQPQFVDPAILFMEDTRNNNTTPSSSSNTSPWTGPYRPIPFPMMNPYIPPPHYAGPPPPSTFGSNSSSSSNQGGEMIQKNMY